MEDKIRYLREDTATSGNLQLSREAYLEADGKLTQEFGLWNHDSEKLLKTAQWEFKDVEDPEPHLKSLDSHWRQLKDEFTRVTEHARHYAAIKTGGNQHDVDDITSDAVADMADGLFYQYASDSDIAAGKPNKRIPLLTYSQRYMSIRESSYDSDIQFDDFEMAVIDLNTMVSKAFTRFDNIVYGMDADEQHLRGEEKETFGDDDQGIVETEFDDDENPPKSSKDGSSFAGESDDGEDEPWHKDADKWKSSSGDYNAFNPDRERDAKIEDAINRYLNQMKSFMQAAEELWLETATQVSKGKLVTRNDKALSMMKYWKKEAADSYGAFKEALADAAGLSGFELQPVYDLLEDEAQGPDASMQKLISMASRPDLLASVIRKGLPPERKRA